MLNTNSTDAGFSAQKASENVWRPGSARTRWGSLSTPPDPLAAKKGEGVRAGEGKGLEKGERAGAGGGQGVGERGQGKGKDKGVREGCRGMERGGGGIGEREGWGDHLSYFPSLASVSNTTLVIAMKPFSNGGRPPS